MACGGVQGSLVDDGDQRTQLISLQIHQSF
jgi:hypothetical protein